jgi:hypothetical protein
VVVVVGVLVVLVELGAGGVVGTRVLDGVDGVDGDSADVAGASDAPVPGSIAAAWLHAEATRQPPISSVSRAGRRRRVVDTTDNLQIEARSRHLFRSCSSTTRSVDGGPKP